jgi:hypothetical protein
MLIGSPYYHRLKPIGTMNTMMAVAAFALAAGNAQAHGSGWVIEQGAKELGITKDFMELTPSDIDKLSDKQAMGLAQLERSMWGPGEGGTKTVEQLSAQDSRGYLKDQYSKFAEMVVRADAGTQQSNDPTHGLKVVKFSWSRGNHMFDIVDGELILKNNGTEAIGNIRYRTYYESETGVIHENSVIDAVIEKVIQPGQTRTIKLEGFVVPSDCEVAGIFIKDCDILPQYTQPSKPRR